VLGGKLLSAVLAFLLAVFTLVASVWADDEEAKVRADRAKLRVIRVKMRFIRVEVP
jgi:hypothetical protein